MAITIGSLVGSGEVTNVKTIDITLTADVLKGDPTTARGLMIVTAKMQDGIAPADFPATYYDVDDDKVRPTVTDDATIQPDYAQPNRLLARMLWQEYINLVQNPAGGFTGMQTAIFNGAFFYIALNDLHSGDVVTIDYTHNVQNITWLGAQIYEIEGIAGHDDGSPQWSQPQTGGGSLSGEASMSWSIGTPTLARLLGMVAMAYEPSISPGALNWSTVSGGAFTALAELNHFEHSINGSYHWRIGYSFYDYGESTTEDKTLQVASEITDTDWQRSSNFLMSTSGPGWPYPIVPKTRVQAQIL